MFLSGCCVRAASRCVVGLRLAVRDSSAPRLTSGASVCSQGFTQTSHATSQWASSGTLPIVQRPTAVVRCDCLNIFALALRDCGLVVLWHFASVLQDASRFFCHSCFPSFPPAFALIFLRGTTSNQGPELRPASAARAPAPLRTAATRGPGRVRRARRTPATASSRGAAAARASTAAARAAVAAAVALIRRDSGDLSLSH